MSAPPVAGRRYDVLIVGAGPVGLTLAAILRRTDRSVLLVDRGRDELGVPRAMHLDRSSVDLLAETGVRWEPGCDLDPLGGVCFEGPAGGRLAITHPTLCPDQLAPFAFHQPSLETELRRLLHGSAVEHHGGCELTGLEPAAGAITAHLRHGTTSARTSVRATIVAGCDGAGSAVRRLARLRLRTLGPASQWHAADLTTTDRRADRLVRHRIGHQSVTVVPGCGRHVRVEALHRRGGSERARNWPAPSVGLLDEALDATIDVVLARRTYRMATRLALRPGRSFGASAVVVLGDAAHTVAPFLGQGLGLGLRDAACLGALLAGSADPASLPAAYTAERRADHLASALQSRAAQLLVEHGARLGPRRLETLLDTLDSAATSRPALVQRAALAGRRVSPTPHRR